MSVIKVCMIRSNPIRPDSRVEKEAYALKQAGYEVSILAWDRENNYKVSLEELNIYDCTIPIYRIGCKASYGDGFKNIVPYLKFQFRMRRWLRKNSNKYDIVHACDFDTAFFSYNLCKRKHKKYIFDIFDFLCSNPQNVFEKIVKKAEFRIINSADATIICTEERKYQISGSRPNELAVIHNTPVRFPVQGEVDIISNSDRTKIAYIGILQDHRLLVESLKFFSTHREYEFHVGGFGKYEKLFRKYANDFDNIYFYGPLPYADALNLERQCDIMTAIYDPAAPEHKYAAPNKFYEALMLGKPLIMCANTGMSEVVLREKIGAIIEYSQEGLECGLNELLSEKSNWKKMKDRMTTLYDCEYNWDQMSKRLVGLYKNISE